MLLIDRRLVGHGPPSVKVCVDRVREDATVVFPTVCTEHKELMGLGPNGAFLKRTHGDDTVIQDRNGNTHQPVFTLELQEPIRCPERRSGHGLLHVEISTLALLS